MFDPDLLESLPPETREMIRGAIMTLQSTGVLTAQKERLFSRLAQGSDAEDKVKLAERILEYRRQSHALEVLIQQGEQYLRESRDESQQSR